MVSKSEINRSGQLLRNEKIGDFSYSEAEILHATRLVEEFRRAFFRPLNLVTSKLRNMVQEMPGDVRVGQRLKRMPQIINKLIRFPETNLVRIQDIAGCRATFQSIEQVEIFLERLDSEMKVKRMKNYIKFPKESGYRAIHVIVERDEKQVEIQLRTQAQQSWADAVEATATRFKIPLKDEIGPEEIIEWLRVTSERIAFTELGIPVPTNFEEEYDMKIEAAQLWMEAQEKQ